MKMFPSRHMMDYMTEINRLFPKNNEKDAVQNQSFFNSTTMASPPNQYGIPNRSSSSNDSTSPETFPEFYPYQSTPEFNLLSNTSSPQSSASDTPIGARRRPIVGRKILSTPEIKRHEVTMQTSPIQMQSPMRRWNEEPDFSTPPFPTEATNTTAHRVYYELFPTENKGFDFKTPVKVQSPPMELTRLNRGSVSPVSSDLRALAVYKGHPNRSPNFSAASSSNEVSAWKMCTFCRKNGETPMVYMTHKVKERMGNDFVVTCPILRSHICPTCGGTGDNAHTITYCPVLRNRNHGLPLQSTTITLKNTRVKSNGRKRF